jgi:ketosteroid isomerase-like protein
MRRLLLPVLLLAALTAIWSPTNGPLDRARANDEATSPVDDWRARDEAGARALFERNLDAIRSRDAETYLSCYLRSDHLVRNGFDGLSLGFADFASGVGDTNWPTLFEATDLRVIAVQPGLVYGQYRYRVGYGEGGLVEQEGISERVFVRTDDGWRIAVTTAFAARPGALAPSSVEEDDRPE